MRLQVSRIVTGRWRENCYFLRRGADAVLIDPGDDAERILAWLSGRASSVRAIMNTHGHHDHVGAVSALKDRLGIPFYLHPGDRKLLTQANFFRSVFDKAPAFEIPEVDAPLTSGAKFSFGDLKLRVLPTPGHTAGGVSFLVEDRLFSGDTLFRGTVGRTDLPGGDKQALKRSLQRLSRLPQKTRVHPGHGPSTRLGRELTENRSLLDHLR